MMHPKDLAIQDFTYDLPDNRIARYPLAERDQSKLLVYKNGVIEESRYTHLDEFIPEHSLLVFNNTKVVEARLLFQKVTGSTIELFCLEPGEQYADITSAMLQKSQVLWKCLVGGAKKWKNELLTRAVQVKNQAYTLTARKLAKIADYYVIEFHWNNAALSFAEVLHQAGGIPLPPYINRAAEEGDKERYQTIYAMHDGSVAAPTAGLHFTPALFEKLDAKSIQRDFVTLHVGAGTFKPVKSATMQHHEMHAEYIDVGRPLIENLLANLNKDIVAVGTTSMRTMESLYWIGVKLACRANSGAHGTAEDNLALTQWEAYDLAAKNIPAKDALQALLDKMIALNTQRLVTKTQIIIAPGYPFKIATGLVTNFHQPQSTLLLLVAALVGDNWHQVYSYALEHDFRFLSYGDGCLLWGKRSP